MGCFKTGALTEGVVGHSLTQELRLALVQWYLMSLQAYKKF